MSECNPKDVGVFLDHWTNSFLLLSLMYIFQTVKSFISVLFIARLKIVQYIQYGVCLFLIFL